MSSFMTVEAKPRIAAGKAEARRLRREGQIPAVAYGKTLASTPLSVSPKDILGVLRSERGRNTIIAMKGVPGQDDLTVMIREYTHHPVSRDLVHVTPNHVCPVINLFDKVVVVRGKEVLGAVKVDARGMVQ